MLFGQLLLDGRVNHVKEKDAIASQAGQWSPLPHNHY